MIGTLALFLLVALLVTNRARRRPLTKLHGTASRHPRTLFIHDDD